MQFLYMKEDVGYEEFLAAVCEAETEGSEGKVVNVKAKGLTVEKIVENRELNELKDLRQQIESLTTIMKSVTVGGNKPKVMGGVSSPRKKEVSGASPWKLFQGSPRKMKGPLKPGQKPIKCYKSDGWGHGWRECPTSGKLKLEGTSGSCSFFNSWKSWVHSHSNPKSKSMIYKILRQSDHYHYVDPLYRLVGEVNETTVLLRARALIDWFSVVIHFIGLGKEIKIESTTTFVCVTD